MSFEILLEDGDLLLQEDGVKGFYREDYEPPVVNIPGDIVTDGAVVSCTLRVNTPKFLTVVIETEGAEITYGNPLVKPPYASLTIDIETDGAEVSTVDAGFVSITRKQKAPKRNLVWVKDLTGKKVNVIARPPD